MILLAGVLLLIPGFVTDIIGLLLFLPPVRDLAWRFLEEPRCHFAGRLRRLPARTSAPAQTVDVAARRSISTPTNTVQPDAGSRADSPWRRIDSD